MTRAMPRPLNPRQERFINEYLIDQNAAAAAIRAGYSPNTKGTHAAELMRNPLICERISAELATLFVGAGITAQNLLKEQARLAYFDPGCLFDAEGHPIPVHQLPPEIRSLLTISYDTKPDGTILMRVRTPNRQQALAALEKRYTQFMAMQMQLLHTQVELAEAQAQAQANETEEEPAPWVEPKLDVPDFRAAPASPAPYGAPDQHAHAPSAAPHRGLINAAAQFLRGNREGEAARAGAQWQQGATQANAASRAG